MNNYAKNKQKIESIRNKCGEIMFRMAISHLMDVGIRHLTEENVEETCNEIMKKDDSKAFMTNEFSCYLVSRAYELAQFPHTDLLVYIQREVVYDVFDGELSYERAMQLLKNCLDWIEEDHLDTLDTFEYLGLEEDEIESLGYGYLIASEDEEDDD